MKSFLFAAALPLAACAPSISQPVAGNASQPPTQASTSNGNAFVCKAFARPSVYDEVKPIGEIRVSEPGDRSISSAAFRFRVLYWNDRYDGRSFITYVYSQSTGKLIEESLFQVYREPLNQFSGPHQSSGPHGFTGLRYVYAPDSPAELQYWCTYG